jgi:hypothetical protein
LHDTLQLHHDSVTSQRGHWARSGKCIFGSLVADKRARTYVALHPLTLITHPSNAARSRTRWYMILNYFLHAGPGTQTLRNIPPSMFQNQQATNRGAPLGANRLQNGKMGKEPARRSSQRHALTTRMTGGASQWAFGGAMGGAPGLSNTQTRTNGAAAMSSFAQAMSGSQPHTPLNLE